MRRRVGKTDPLEEGIQETINVSGMDGQTDRSGTWRLEKLHLSYRGDDLAVMI